MSHAVATINGHTVTVVGPDAEATLKRFTDLDDRLSKLLYEPDGWLTTYPSLGITTACAGASKPSLLQGATAEPMFTHSRIKLTFSTQLRYQHGNQDSLFPTSN